MILGHVKCGQGQNEIVLFQQMQKEDVRLDFVTFVGVLNACANMEVIEEGKQVHEQIIESGWVSNVFVHNSLVNMYAKCGSLEDAWRVFNKMVSCDVVFWNAMIWGHVKSRQAQKALQLFHRMQHEDVQPNSVTLVGVLNACLSIEAFEEGKHAHE
jgi:pentatricopeptide repeat protein